MWLATAWLPGASAQTSASQDAITARAWLSDPSGQLGPEQVRPMTWTPYTGRLRRGYTSATTWVRLTLEPPAQAGQRGNRGANPIRWVLRIQPGQIDEVALFDPRLAGQPPQLTGDRHDWRLGEYRSFNHNLVIAAPTAPIELLLRLRTTSHHALDVEALRWDMAQERDGDQQLRLGGFCCFVLMMLTWSGWSWWRTRERVIGAFFVQQAISTLFVFSLLGLFRVYLSDALPALLLDTITCWLFPLTQTASIWFHWHFLREFKPPRLGMRCLQALMALLPVECLLLLTGQTRAALQLNVVVTALTSLLLVAMVWRIAPPGPQDTGRLLRHQLLRVYSLMLLTLFSTSLPALGWLPSPPWGSSGVLLYAFASALLIASALQARVKHQAGAHSRTLIALSLSQQQVAQERDRRQEQAQFLAMLTHELTTPLAVASMALGSLVEGSAVRVRAYRAVESMRDLIQRCALSGELDHPERTLQRSAVDVPDLLQELRDGFRADRPASSPIALELDAGLPHCLTDRRLLAVILGNLMDNALKYGAQGGTVTVTASTLQRGHQAGLLLSVSNRPGPAGRPDTARLFRKYQRGRAAMGQSGSGLGLYLSAKVASRLGGELVHPAQTADVRFVLWLPA